MMLQRLINNLSIGLTSFGIALFYNLILCNASGPCALLEPHAKAPCIPLQAINRAFRDARFLIGLDHPIVFSKHELHKHHNEIDLLGMVLTQTTKYLAKEFQLSHEQIYNLLPNLDLELTDIWNFCPLPFRHKSCKLSKYRTISGHCNNLNHPDWGASHSNFVYLLPPLRHDGVDEPKNSENLPPARIVSSRIHRDHVTHDHAITTMLIAWGQIIDHDITFTAESKDPHTHKDPDCCHQDKYGHSHHNCYPIHIPEYDTFYSLHGHQCMNFARSLSGVRSECRLGPRTSFNTISSFLDASFIYGSNEYLAMHLRLGKYGMLKSLPILERYGLKDLLPLKVEDPWDGCMQPNPDVFCFLAGDKRVNEQLVLTVLHTIFMREHNRIAHRLHKINHQWDDEKLYQETRRIIVAIVQHITYEEFLPMVLGKKLMNEYGISIKDEEYWNGYDPNVNPSAREEFITSAFRFGHSLLPHKIERWSHSHRYIESTDLSKLIRQPFDMYRPGYVDTFIMGMVNQLAQAMDEGVTEQVTTMLFKEPKKHFGMDLAAMNTQRGRDHAIQGYTAYRKLCGLPPINSWHDLIGIMKNETIYHYKEIYRSPNDIDLWSGGVSEISSYGSLIGPTFGCIISKQFQTLRFGDRYWYELPHLPSSFTQEQLYEIKKTKLSRMLCDNSDSIKSIQVYPMVYPDPVRNPRVPCKGSVIPRIDLEKWRDFSTEIKLENYHSPRNPKHNALNIHTNDYQTLQPPKFDQFFINASSSSLYNTDVDYVHEFPPEFHYNSSHETTQFPKGSQTYPHFDDSDHTYSKNSYQAQITEYNPENTNLLEYNYNQNSTSHKSSHVQPVYHEDYEYFQNDEYAPLETIEPPQVESTLIFIPPQRDNLIKYDPTAPNPIRTVILKKRPRKPNPIPQSPFPGLGGIFSPNPGYLVREKFTPLRSHSHVIPHRRY